MARLSCLANSEKWNPARELNSSKADGVNSLLSPLLYVVAGHCIGWLGAMVKFKSISVRIMVAISLVAA
ncbi:MAG: hypothetical protein EKK36_11700, partial [Bradyrhizobiaceae bacterium]